ncbi:cytochrome c oxidase assembly protein [Rubellimicrobium roseum]|uniref:Cytochrome c oxidase assembly protein n=1 Tax=Rubellimicrobium roseum TaxID=687525 RepID=A0A5C4NJL7_9RHOB|nr:cytochrome c oxidase assembly protein [Rubellimicrobium roseum]TNC74984.1 cytochrome c oxidase assembly protein [Rubellimicrobium roseum]
MSRALRLPALLLLGVGITAPLGGNGFPSHMLGHMTLVALAAPLLVLAWPAAFARLEVPPLAGAVIEFAVVWGWHLPALHGAARLSGSWFLAEQLLFLLGGLAVWISALGAAQPLAGAGALLLTSMHMTLLGALLVLAPSDLYAAICGTPPDVWAQGIGGLLMLGIGTPVYLIAGLALTARALRGDNEEPA